MNIQSKQWPFLLVLGLLASVVACDSDSPTAPPDDDPPTPNEAYLPPVPEPTSVNQTLPDYSDTLVVGMSNRLRDFVPRATELLFTDEAGQSVAVDWRDQEAVLVCDGSTTWNSSNAVWGGSYIDEAPRLLHRRYWKKLNRQTLGPGSGYEVAETETWGHSTTDATTRSFATTIGAEVAAGTGDWSPLALSIKGSYSQTETATELESVTISTGGSRTVTYDVSAPSDADAVWVLWQLVDEFVIVDADSIPIAASPTLRFATIRDVDPVSWPHETLRRQSVTLFPR